MAEKLQLWHKICQFHVLRWVGRVLRELQKTVPKEWLWVLNEIHALLDVLPPDGSQTLYALWKQLPGRRSKRNQSHSPLDQQCLRTFDWQNENESPYRPGLQILVRYAFWPALGCH